MFASYTRLLVASLAVLAGSLMVNREAQAGGCYGAFSIHNCSGTSIHYQIRWGDGDWKTICVGPGCTYTHWNELDENGRVPSPKVRFDWIAGDNEVSNRTYGVDVIATHYPRSEAKEYKFRYSRCGCFLDLYK